MSDAVDWPILGTLAKENDALRARVAKLEAALEEARTDFEMWHEKTSVAKIDAALMTAPEAPESRSRGGTDTSDGTPEREC